MPFKPSPTFAQNDLLGPLRLQQWSSNIGYLRWMHAQEHLIGSGEHNAVEIPRECRRINGTTVSPTAAYITSVTNPSTGRYVINLDATYFTDINALRVQINVAGDGTKPYLHRWFAVSATQIEVHISKLSSTLGSSGNSWAASGSEFDIAIHHNALAQNVVASWASLPVLWDRGDYLTDRATGLNTIIQEGAEIQTALIVQHASTGEHNVHEVAKYSARILYDSSGPSYTRVGGSGITPTRASTGVVYLDHSALDVTSNAINSFPYPDYQRYSSGGDASAPQVVNIVPTSSTRQTAHIFQWIAASNWWQVAEGDFYVVIHGDL